MKIIEKVLLVFLFPLLCYAQDKETLEVSVINLSHNLGDVYILLFNCRDGFPNKHTKACVMDKTSINNLSCKVTLSDVPYGEYAVSILHDENGNGDIDTIPILGFPLEGFDTSNVDKLRRPNYDRSKFQFNNRTVGVTVPALYLPKLFRWMLALKK